MKEQNHIEFTSEQDIVCDNPACDYVDTEADFDKLEDYLNKPCPKCGENLLTEEDLKNHQLVIATAQFINSLTEDELDNLNFLALGSLTEEQKNEIMKFGKDDKLAVEVHTHNGVSMTVVNKENIEEK